VLIIWFFFYIGISKYTVQKNVKFTDSLYIISYCSYQNHSAIKLYIIFVVGVVFKHSKLTNILELRVLNQINKITSWHTVLIGAFKSVLLYKERL
jgi:hypothetical protein